MFEADVIQSENHVNNHRIRKTMWQLKKMETMLICIKTITAPALIMQLNTTVSRPIKRVQKV